MYYVILYSTSVISIVLYSGIYSVYNTLVYSS